MLYISNSLTSSIFRTSCCKILRMHQDEFFFDDLVPQSLQAQWFLHVQNHLGLSTCPQALSCIFQSCQTLVVHPRTNLLVHTKLPELNQSLDLLGLYPP